MADNLLEMLKSQLSGPLLDRLATAVGLDPATARKVLEGSSATLLSGLALKAQKPGGGDAISDILKKGGYDGGLLDNLGDVLGSPQKTDEVTRQGGGLLEAIFGPQLSAILGLLGKVFGVGTNIIGKLLPLLAPIILSQIGKVAMGKGLGSSGLADLLKSQLPMLKGALPPGLDGVLGLADLGPGVTDRVGAASTSAVRTTQAAANQAAGGFNKILPWLALAALLLAGLFFLPRMMSGPAEPVADGVPETAPADTPKPVEPQTPRPDLPTEPNPGMAAAMGPAMTSLELPGGTKLDVPAGSVFEQLVKHMQAPNPDLSKTFALDALAFAPDTATPTSTIAGFDVNTVLDWLAKILAAFPNAHIKLVGVSEGERAASLAEAVKAVLVTLGVGADRVAVESAAPAPVPADAPKPAPHVEVGVTKL